VIPPKPVAICVRRTIRPVLNATPSVCATRSPSVGRYAQQGGTPRQGPLRCAYRPLEGTEWRYWPLGR
jgi:hypothetical protein